MDRKYRIDKALDEIMRIADKIPNIPYVWAISSDRSTPPTGDWISYSWVSGPHEPRPARHPADMPTQSEVADHLKQLLEKA